jgi:hypothetical protein
VSRAPGLVALAVLLALLPAAGAGAAPERTLQGSLMRVLFGPRMVRAEVIVMEGEAVRDLRVDRGRIRWVGPRQLRLLERDATIVAIPLDEATSVWTRGVRAPLAALRRGANVTTVRSADQAALHVVQPAQALPKALTDVLFGPQVIRAEVIVLDGTLRDFRVDHGEIVALGPRMLRLRELDGQVVTVGIAGRASIRLDGRRTRWARLRTGMRATVLREGAGEASLVDATAAP